MSLSNKISIEITPDQSAAIAAAFQQFKTVLAPVLTINLTAEDRQKGSIERPRICPEIKKLSASDKKHAQQ